MNKVFPPGILLILVLLLQFNLAKAIDYTSNSTGNWSNPTTWSPPGIPDSSSNVTIAPGNFITVNGNYSCNSLTINSGGTVTASQSFTISGTITVGLSGIYNQANGLLTITGNIIDSGAISAGATGAIALTGDNVKIIGVGSINQPSGFVSIANNKIIPSGSTITFGTPGSNTSLDIATGTRVSNSGAVAVNGNITGDDISATWVNNYGSALSITGALLNTGTLEASAALNTITYNGSNNQIITAPLSSYYNLVVSNGGVKALAAPVQADYAVVVNNAVTLDEGTYALTGSASLTMNNDSSELKLVRSAYGSYPELSGAYTLTGGTVTINQTSDSTIVTPAVYYNLNLGGSAPFDIFGVSAITNNFSMANAASLSNSYAIHIGGLFTYNSSAYTTLFNDVTANGIVLLAGTLDDGGHNVIIDGAGGWAMNGGAFNSTGKTEFYPAAPVAQTIGGNSTTTFYNLVINNAAGVTLNLNAAGTTNVSGYLDLTNGNINTDSSNMLLMQANATVLHGSSGSYVSGPMQKAGGVPFVFPVGKNGIYAQAGVSGAVNASTLVTAEYFATGYSTLTPKATGLNEVNDQEYWVINRTLSQDPLQVQLYWTNASANNITNCAGLTLVSYTGKEWMSEPAVALGGSVCTGTGSGSVQTTQYISSFGPFTFGSVADSASAPIITLVSFNAAAVPGKNAVLTTWETSAEINNAYFMVERSTDGENFASIDTVIGAGSSSALTYSFTDEAPLKGTSYYRLEQTDNTGYTTKSDIVAVNFALAQSSLNMYPNPANGQVSLNITNPSDEVVIHIYDLAGEVVFSKNYSASASSMGQLISLPLSGKLGSGIYTLKASTDQSDFTEKLVVQ